MVVAARATPEVVPSLKDYRGILVSVSISEVAKAVIVSLAEELGFKPINVASSAWRSTPRHWAYSLSADF